MKKVHRRLLLFTATVVFLAIAPLVTLYAIGYRTPAVKVDPLPVGVVVIETIPRRAQVTVDGQAVGRTPRSIPNILAGTVRVALSLDGYHSWEKVLPVEPGLVTELRTVRLFAARRTPQRLIDDVEQFSLSPNRKLLAAYQSDDTLQLLDEDGQALALPLKLAQRPDEFLWAPNSSALLLRYRGGNIATVEISAGTLALKALPVRNITEVVWDPRIPGRILTLQTDRGLRAFNTATASNLLIASRVEQFATSSRYIYSVNDTNVITVQTLQGSVVRRLTIPAAAGASKLLVTPAGTLALIASDGRLYIERDEALFEVSTAVSSAAWSPDGQMLLVQREPNALYVYNELDERSPLPLQELHLVTRLSRPITHAAWFAGGAHVLYQADDELIIVETDTRDHPVEHTVDTTNIGDALAAVGEEGAYLFYLKKDGTNSSVLRMPFWVE